MGHTMVQSLVGLPYLSYPPYHIDDLDIAKYDIFLDQHPWNNILKTKGVHSCSWRSTFLLSLFVNEPQILDHLGKARLSTPTMKQSNLAK